MAKAALALAFLALVASIATEARVLQQAPEPVSAEQVKTALSKINQYAQVPDTSEAVAETPNFADRIASVQGPASTIVRASDTLAEAPSPAKTDATNALRAFGSQSGMSNLGPAGQQLYEAYAAVSNAVFTN